MSDGIRITSQKEGFRRAGMAHPKAPTTYPTDKFTKEQLDALRAEPMLMVVPVEIPDPDPEENPETDDPKPKTNKKK